MKLISPKRNLSLNKKLRGFTLLEMLVVVLIIGLLVAIVAASIMHRPDEARITTTKSQIRAFEQALDLYRLDNSHYPSTEQGLQALVEKPSGFPEPRSWRNSYMKKIPKDPWSNDYVYENNDSGFVITSYGSDGEEDGEGVAADIISTEI